MKYTFSTNINQEEYDRFVQNHPDCNLLQSYSWALVKENWNPIYTGVYDEAKKLVAAGLVLIKRLPLSFTLFYVPRGPIMNYEQEDLVAFYFSELKKVAKKQHCLYITLDPAFICNEYKIEERNENRFEKTEAFLNTMKKNGAIFKGFTKNIEDTIQPRYHAMVFNQEDVVSHFSKSCKKALNTVKKKNVQLKAYHTEGVKDFSKVMHCTEERKNIHLRGEEYFKKLMEVYKEDAVIYLATLDLKSKYEETKQRYEKNIKDLEACPEHAKKKRFTLEELDVSLTRELNELKQFREEDGDFAILSGALCIKYGKTSELLYAGMDNRYKRYMAPYASFYKCMEWSFKHGCTWCNMGGIEGNFDGGLTKFKSNYNPTIVEYVGEFDIPVNKCLYTLSKKAYSYMKKKNSHE